MNARQIADGDGDGMDETRAERALECLQGAKFPACFRAGLHRHGVALRRLLPSVRNECTLQRNLWLLERGSDGPSVRPGSFGTGKPPEMPYYLGRARTRC